MLRTDFNKLATGGGLLRKDASLADLTAAAQSARAAFERAKINRAPPKALAAAESEAIYRERLLANARATKTSFPAGAGASSRAITRPGADPEIARLVSASKCALEQFNLTKAGGSPSAIAAARAELRTMMKRLEVARVDAVLQATMSAALRTPRALGC